MTEHVREHLSPFLDGELTAPDRAAVEAHLQACPECAAHLEELATLDALARDLPAPAPADGFEAFPARVRARIAAHGRRPRRIPAWGLAAAAALLLAVITPLTLMQRSASPVRSPADTAGYPAAAPAATLAASPAPPSPLEALEKSRQVDRVGGRDRAPGGALAPAPAKLEQAPKDAEGYVAQSPEEARLRRRMVVPEAQRQVEAPRPTLAAGDDDNGLLDSVPAPTPAPARPSPQSKRDGSGFAGPTATASKDQPAARGPRGEAKANAPAPAAPAVPPPPPAAEADQRLDEREAGGKAGGDPATKTLRSKGSVTPAADTPGTNTVGAGGLSSEAVYAELRARRPETPQAARELRDAWRRLAQVRPEGAEADEARTRTIDLGLAAWQLSGEAQDRAVLLRDLADYLARKDAPQAERMRVLRQSVERP